MNTTWMNNVAVPQVKIIEQPSSKGTRFRYECEGRFSNNILGASGKKSFPTIRIINYTGPLSIIVSCVTKDQPYRPHPHKLVNGNDIQEHGICLFRIPENNKHDISFRHLSVQCTAKRNIIKSLTERERVQIDPFKTGFLHRNKPESIDLNCIRLCFQVFIETTQNLIPLQPIVSEPVYDKKAVSDLKICWLSHHSASVAGGTQMCILCEKVSKLDIEVRFFHEESNWEAIAILTKPEVFRQVAIVFETPEYRTASCSPELVHKPLNVRVQLRRISDKETSQTVPFQLLPLACVYYESHASQTSIKRKREKYNEGHSGIISKRIQAEVTGADKSQPNYSKPEIAKSSHELNEIKKESFELPKFDKSSVELLEPWELPPLRQSNCVQPQSGNCSRTSSCMNVLIETSPGRKRLIENLDKRNIESEEANALSPYKKYDSLDTLDSDNWINDLLGTINKEHANNLNNELKTANNAAHDSQEAFPNYHEINNNPPFANTHQSDNFNNLNFLEDSDTTDFINHMNIYEELINHPEGLYYNKDEPVQTENNALTDESIQDFINLLNDLS